jgi:hypothetical protein
LNLNVRISNVKISNFFLGIFISGFYNALSDTNYISNNIIDSCKEGIATSMNNVKIRNNFVTASESSLIMQIGSFV